MMSMHTVRVGAGDVVDDGECDGGVDACADDVYG